MAEEFMVAKDLHKSFNDFKAVNGVSFSIAKGEIFGLLGPNGAGKTTTIRMLSTVLTPDSGEITIGGHSLSREADTTTRCAPSAAAARPWARNSSSGERT